MARYALGQPLRAPSKEDARRFRRFSSFQSRVPGVNLGIINNNKKIDYEVIERAVLLFGLWALYLIPGGDISSSFSFYNYDTFPTRLNNAQATFRPPTLSRFPFAPCFCVL